MGTGLKYQQTVWKFSLNHNYDTYLSNKYPRQHTVHNGSSCVERLLSTSHQNVLYKY